jgi:hypothetical protein
MQTIRGITPAKEEKLGAFWATFRMSGLIEMAATYALSPGRSILIPDIPRSQKIQILPVTLSALAEKRNSCSAVWTLTFLIIDMRIIWGWLRHYRRKVESSVRKTV